MSSVLYDTPGPRAIRRNRILGVVTVLVVAAVLAFVVYRLFETGQFESKKWELFTLPLVHQNMFNALLNTLQAFAYAAVLSLILGLVLSLGRMSVHKWVKYPATAFIELFRAVPLLILMFILYYGLPPLGVEGITPFIAVVTGLTLYNGSVLAEVFRAGVEGLPIGQAESGYAIGLRKSQVMRIILLPQAVRNMLPVIISQLVVVLKDTALGFLITYQELLFLAKFYGSQGQYGSPIIPSAIVFGTIYILLCLALAGVAKLVELRLRSKVGVATKAAGQEIDAGV